MSRKIFCTVAAIAVLSVGYCWYSRQHNSDQDPKTAESQRDNPNSSTKYNYSNAGEVDKLINELPHDELVKLLGSSHESHNVLFLIMRDCCGGNPDVIDKVLAKLSSKELADILQERDGDSGNVLLEIMVSCKPDLAKKVIAGIDDDTLYELLKTWCKCDFKTMYCVLSCIGDRQAVVDKLLGAIDNDSLFNFVDGFLYNQRIFAYLYNDSVATFKKILDKLDNAKLAKLLKSTTVVGMENDNKYGTVFYNVMSSDKDDVKELVLQRLSKNISELQGIISNIDPEYIHEHIDDAKKAWSGIYGLCGNNDVRRHVESVAGEYSIKLDQV